MFKSEIMCKMYCMLFYYSRSRSPHGDSKRRRSGAHDPDPNTGAAAPSTDPEIMQDGVVAAPAGDVGPSEPVDYDAALTPEEIQMMMAMGIPFVSGLLCRGVQV